jgi:hypothetical protein
MTESFLSIHKIPKHAAFSLSPRGTSGERVRERGPPENAPPLPGPLLHFMEERELPSVAARPRCVHPSFLFWIAAAEA